MIFFCKLRLLTLSGNSRFQQSNVIWDTKVSSEFSFTSLYKLYIEM